MRAIKAVSGFFKGFIGETLVFLFLLMAGDFAAAVPTTDLTANIYDGAVSTGGTTPTVGAWQGYSYTFAAPPGGATAITILGRNDCGSFIVDNVSVKDGSNNELIVNGNFSGGVSVGSIDSDTGVPTAWTRGGVSGATGSMTVLSQGQATTNGYPNDSGGSSYPALFLSLQSGFGGVMQIIPTTGGANYTLSFRMYYYDGVGCGGWIGTNASALDSSESGTISQLLVYAGNPPAGFVAYPSVTTNAASSVSSSAATLNATATDNGANTTVTFEYGTSAGTYSTTGVVPDSNGSISAGAGTKSVSKALTGLTGSTTYYYRVKAVNSQGTNYGAEQSFTTSAPSYTVTYNGNGNTGGSVPTDGSSPYAGSSTVTVLGNTGSLTRTGYVFAGWNTAANGSGTGYAASATFPIAANTTLYAQWTATYSITYNGNGNTGGSAPTDGSSPYASGATVTVNGAGSLSKTGYNFIGWNTASDGSGTSRAVGSTFSIAANTTLYAQWAGAPAATTNAASSVAGTTATLNGTVDDKGASTTITFEYGTTSGAGGSYTYTGITPTSNGTLAAGAGATSVSKGISGLSYSTTYYYRVKGVNSQGTTYGSEQSFTTSKQAQTITFTGPSTQNIGASPTLSASSTSGLTVVFSSADTNVCTVSGTTVTLVAAGTCTINANQAGNSSYLAASQVQQSFTVNAVAPDAPTAVSASGGDSSASVSFTAPANNGGASISSYTATCTSGDGGVSGNNTGSSSPISISGLTNGKTYTCTVTATNSAGTSSASTASGSFSPATGPLVSSVAVPANGRYKAGSNLDFTVTWDNATTVTGTPRLALTIGSATRYANYLSGSGTTATVFRHTVQAGDSDTDGITVGALGLNGGTIQDGSSRNATLTLNSVASTTSVLVDTTAPTLPAANVVVNNSADPHKLILTFSEALDATSLGSAAGWTVTDNGGSTTYSLASVGLSGGGNNVITLTLNSVDLSGSSTAITSAAAAHLKVTPPATLKDLAGNTYAAGLVTEAGATHVLDGTDPTLSTVATSSPSASGGTLTATASEKAKGYWIAVAQGATAPSVAEVKAGANYGAVTVVAHGSGVLPAGTAGSLSLSGLAASTAYDLYLMAEDAAGRTVAAVETATLTTTAAPVVVTPATNPFNPAGSTTQTTVTTTVGSSLGGDTVVTKATTSIISNLPEVNQTTGVSDNGVVVVLAPPGKTIKLVDNAPNGVLFSLPTQQSVPVQVQGQTVSITTGSETVTDGSGKVPSPVLATRTVTTSSGSTQQVLEIVSGQGTIRATAAGQIIGALTLSQGGTLRTVTIADSSGQGGGTTVPGSAGFFKNPTDKSGSVSAENGTVVLNVVLTPEVRPAANRLAAESVTKQITLQTGEVARFNAQGELVGVYAGSLSGKLGKTGDPMSTTPPAGLTAYPAKAVKLDGNALDRLSGNLLPAFASAVSGTSNFAAENEVADSLSQDSNTGIVTARYSARPDVRFLGLPIGDVTINPDTADGMVWHSNGSVTWTRTGVSVTFAPVSGSLSDLAASAKQGGFTSQLLDNGVLKLTGTGSYLVGLPRFSAEKQGKAAGFGWDEATQRASFTDAQGYTQVIDPVPYDGSQLDATVAALNGWTLSREYFLYGTLRLSGPAGAQFLLTPDYAVGVGQDSRLGGSAYTGPDGRLYYGFSTGFLPFAQGFGVK